MVDVRFREVVIDCADPPTLAKWWSDFTGYAPRTTRGDWSTIESPDKAMIIGFQKVPEGKVVKNRMRARSERRHPALGERRPRGSVRGACRPGRERVLLDQRRVIGSYCVAITSRVRMSRCAS